MLRPMIVGEQFVAKIEGTTFFSWFPKLLNGTAGSLFNQRPLAAPFALLFLFFFFFVQLFGNWPKDMICSRAPLSAWEATIECFKREKEAFIVAKVVIVNQRVWLPVEPQQLDIFFLSILYNFFHLTTTNSKISPLFWKKYIYTCDAEIGVTVGAFALLEEEYRKGGIVMWSIGWILADREPHCFSHLTPGEPLIWP